MTTKGPESPAPTEKPGEQKQANDAPPTPVDLRPTESRRPSKPVPTNRIAFAKQLDLLRAYAAASGLERKPVSLGEVATIAGMTAQTASLANAFFADVGFLQRADGGFVPSQAVHDYVAAYEWDRETAALKLAPALRDSWPFKVLSPRLQFSPQPEHEAIRLLAEDCGASPDYRPQLIIAIAYLEAANLIERDGNTLRLPRAAAQKQPATPAAETTEKEKDKSGGSSGGGEVPPPPPSIHPALIGLLQLLPAPQTSWGKGKQGWLKAFTAAIDAVYPEDGGSSSDGGGEV